MNLEFGARGKQVWGKLVRWHCVAGALHHTLMQITHNKICTIDGTADQCVPPPNWNSGTAVTERHRTTFATLLYKQWGIHNFTTYSDKPACKRPRTENKMEMQWLSKKLVYVYVKIQNLILWHHMQRAHISIINLLMPKSLPFAFWNNRMWKLPRRPHLSHFTGCNMLENELSQAPQVMSVPSALHKTVWFSWILSAEYLWWEAYLFIS